MSLSNVQSDSYVLDPERPLRDRSADELSELEAFIDYCCQKAVASGYWITTKVTLEQDDWGQHVCCPLGAVGVVTNQWWDQEMIFQDFQNGVDGVVFRPVGRDSVSYSMGRRFRERLHRGEYLRWR
jgi:hypothetical protein